MYMYNVYVCVHIYIYICIHIYIYIYIYTMTEMSWKRKYVVRVDSRSLTQLITPAFRRLAKYC